MYDLHFYSFGYFTLTCWLVSCVCFHEGGGASVPPPRWEGRSSAPPGNPQQVLESLPRCTITCTSWDVCFCSLLLSPTILLWFLLFWELTAAQLQTFLVPSVTYDLPHSMYVYVYIYLYIYLESILYVKRMGNILYLLVLYYVVDWSCLVIMSACPTTKLL